MTVESYHPKRSSASDLKRQQEWLWSSGGCPDHERQWCMVLVSPWLHLQLELRRTGPGNFGHTHLFASPQAGQQSQWPAKITAAEPVKQRLERESETDETRLVFRVGLYVGGTLQAFKTGFFHVQETILPSKTEASPWTFLDWVAGSS